MFYPQNVVQKFGTRFVVVNFSIDGIEIYQILHGLVMQFADFDVLERRNDYIS